MNKKISHKKILVFILLIINISLMSNLVVLTKTKHHHDHLGEHDTCAACSYLKNVETLLKQLGTVFAEPSAISLALFTLLFLIEIRSTYFSNATPVSLKIRMNH